MNLPLQARGGGGWDLLRIAAFAAVLFVTGLGARDLWNPNEPVYGRAVVEMIDGGRWLVPSVNGEVFAEKPILYYWLARVAAAATGQPDEFALRLPLALAGIACVLMVYLLVLPDGGVVRARLAAVLLATTYLVFWTARSVQMDLLLAVATLAAVLAGYAAIVRRIGPAAGWGLAGCAAGVGFLAKGPAGWVLPGLVLLAFLLSGKERREALRPGAIAWAAGAALLVAAPWCLALWFRDETALLHEMLLRQNVIRFLDAWDHREPFWYFGVYFWSDMAPWSLFLPLAAGLPVRNRDVRRLDRLAWCWIAVVLVFFSLSQSKRSAYLLPLAPAVAVLVSGLAERLLQGGLDPVRRRGVMILLGFWGAVLLAAAAVLQFRALPDHPLVGRSGTATALLFLAGGVAVLSALFTSRRPARLAASAFLAVSVSTYLLVGVWLLPAIDPYKSARSFALAVEERVGADAPVKTYRDWKWRADVSYYAGRDIGRIESREQLERFWEQPRPAWLIVEADLWPEVRDLPGAAEPRARREVGSRELLLLGNPATTAANRPATTTPD